MLIASGKVLMRCYGVTQEEFEAVATKITDNHGMVAYTMPLHVLIDTILSQFGGRGHDRY